MNTEDYPALSLARNRIAHAPTYGDVQIRRHIDGDDTWLTVVHCDPHALVADEVLCSLVANPAEPQLEVWLSEPTNRPPCEGDACPKMPCWTDWLLHIEARNRTVVYCIGRWVEELNCWEATWPD